jgi:acetyl esterase/lipase
VSLALRVVVSALLPPATVRFGSDSSQRAELHAPRHVTSPVPVVVLLHGGYWQTRFGKLVCRPLARDVVAHGWAAWNLEYRRLGEGRGGGGGWPMTFDDVAAGIDHLADLADPRLDLSRVVLVGHSAGGQLALWAAGRAQLPARATGATPRVAVCAVVGLAPVTNLRRAGVHARVLLGGEPEEVPERWALADPMAVAPPPVPALLVHPADDATIPLARSLAYVERCRVAGGDVSLVAPEGEGHRDAVDPTSRSWAAAVAWLTELLKASGSVGGRS